MSESRAFANYSNVSRSLQSSAGRQQSAVAETFADKINDAKNFEQQFLIGMAVHQKAKVGENLVKIFKGSKKLQKSTGLSEDDLTDIVNGDFSGITGKIAKATSKKLQSSIKTLRDAKDQNKIDLQDLEARKTIQSIKQDISNKLGVEKENAEREASDAQNAVNDADGEVQRLANIAKPDADALEETARSLRAGADADRAASDLAKQNAEGITSMRPSADSTADDVRLEPNPEYDNAVNRAEFFGRNADASERAATDAENAASDARATVTSLASQQADAAQVADAARATLASKTSAAAEKANSAEEATASADAATESVAAGEAGIAEGVTKVSKLAGDLSKVKDTEEAAVASSEADPLGLVVAAIGAVAASLIGRAVKTHTAVAPILTPPVSSSFAATIGA